MMHSERMLKLIVPAVNLIIPRHSKYGIFTGPNLFGEFFPFFGGFFSILGFCEILEEASHETIILEVSYVKIVGSLARNDYFGSFLCQNCRKPRTKRSFWKLLMSKLLEASQETIILEASYVKIVGSLARNDHFGSFLCQNCWKPRKKQSFWNLLMSKWSEASHETIILEASYVKIVGSLARNDHFGSFLCQNCRKPHTKRSFWKLLMSKLLEASQETLVLEADARFGSLFCEIWRRPCTKRSFWKLFLYCLEVQGG